MKMAGNAYQHSISPEDDFGRMEGATEHATFWVSILYMYVYIYIYRELSIYVYLCMYTIYIDTPWVSLRHTLGVSILYMYVYIYRELSVYIYLYMYTTYIDTPTYI